MVYLVAHAGLRPGEVAALLQADIYWSTGAHGEILVDKQTWREVTDSTKTNVVTRLHTCQLRKWFQKSETAKSPTASDPADDPRPHVLK